MYLYNLFDQAAYSWSNCGAYKKAYLSAVFSQQPKIDKRPGFHEKQFSQPLTKEENAVSEYYYHI